MLGRMTGVSVETHAASAVRLTKTYGHGQAAVRALDEVSVTFDRGRFTAVMGPSGSGKSTLMHCMAGLDRPTSGTLMGLALVSALRQQGITETTVPVVRLVEFLVLAALLGLVAASWPARRAARLDVLAAIAAE
jgi:predicted ABC-type transport system involved in lysophospholipase L1 biosynthesis ATPase subunit